MCTANKFMVMPLLMLSTALWLAFDSFAWAQNIHSLEDIQQVAEQYLLAAIPKDAAVRRATAEHLDPRLRLTQCQQPLQAFLPNGASIGPRTTVAVRCNAPEYWTLYVPVNLSTQVSALVLKRAVLRGQSVEISDVESRAQWVTGSGADWIGDIAELHGQHAKRDLSVGAPLTSQMLEHDLVIRRGQQVTLLAVVGGIEVRSQGIALNDGQESSRVRVRNLASSKVVEGIADGNSQVRVDL